MKIFYGRVSSKEQNESRQLKNAADAGVEERYIFIDKGTGKNFDRVEFQLVLRILREGDELYISSLDRLGRNYSETAKAWEYITKEIKAHIIVMDMPLLDTRSQSDVTGELIQDIIIRLLCYVADRELAAIHERQKAGIALARARGAYNGRKPKEVDKTTFEKLCAEIDAGERTAASAYRKMGLSVATFYRMRKEMKEKTGRWAEKNK